MCSGRLRAAIFAVLALAPAPAPAATLTREAAADLLRRSDVATLAPVSFRARLRITVLREPPDSMDIEVWRSGESKSLVRFLGPQEKGKYLLRLDGVVWFLAPGARKPVKVSPARRLRGSASLDDILGIRYGRDYVVEGATETGEAGDPLVVLDLVARSAHAPYPKVRYVVRRATERPVRAEYLLPSGKTASVVEFLEWETGSRPVVRRLVLTDHLRAGLRTEVRLLEMEERKIPDGLFDLGDPTERRKLEEGSSEDVPRSSVVPAAHRPPLAGW
jgi:Outer membrane lipoprotein-sorting protein